MTNNEKVLVYETLLSSPGMGESVKIDLRVSRKLILLLSQVIDKQISEGTELFALFPKELKAELASFGNDCLEKGVLQDLSGRLKNLK